MTNNPASANITTITTRPRLTANHHRRHQRCWLVPCPKDNGQQKKEHLMIILLFHCDVACCLQKAEMGFPALPNTRTINDTTGMMSGALDSLSYLVMKIATGKS